MNSGGTQSSDEILLEFTQAGNQVRVAAIHAGTGVEVVAIAPANATRLQMQQLVLAKLRRRLEQLGKA